MVGYVCPRQEKKMKAKRNYIIIFYLLRRKRCKKVYFSHILYILALPFGTIIIIMVGRWKERKKIINLRLEIMSEFFFFIKHKVIEELKSTIYLANKSFKLNFKHQMHIKSHAVAVAWGRNRVLLHALCKLRLALCEAYGSQRQKCGIAQRGKKNSAIFRKNAS